MNRRAFLLLLIGLPTLLLGLGAAWFFENFEKITVETDEGDFQGEAKRKPYLAAQYLLQHSGAQVEYLHTLPRVETLPVEQAALLLLPNQAVLNQAQSDALLAWVERGGHLLFEAWSEEAAKEPLLSALGVSLLLGSEDAGFQRVRSKWLNGSVLETDFNADYVLQQDAEVQPRPRWQLTGTQGAHVLDFAYGKGRLTLLSSSSFLTNAEIGIASHAELLWRLLREAPQPRERIWLAHLLSGADTEPLWQMLWREARPLLLSLGLLLAAWLWMRMRRFGPLLPEPARERRRLLEHVEASGQFLWRHRQGALLLKESRRAVLQRIRLVHPDWLHLSPQALQTHLAILCGQAPEKIAQALYHDGFDNEAAFADSVRILQQIRTHL